MDSTTTRRALVGAIGLGLPVAALAQAAPAAIMAVDTAGWDRALAAYHSAEKAHTDYHRAYVSPADKAHTALVGDWPNRRDLSSDPTAQAEERRLFAAYLVHQNRYDELVGTWFDAATALLLTPAPHGAALIEKLDIIYQHQLWDCDLSEIMPAVRSDAQRLFSGEA